VGVVLKNGLPRPLPEGIPGEEMSYNYKFPVGAIPAVADNT